MATTLSPGPATRTRSFSRQRPGGSETPRRILPKGRTSRTLSLQRTSTATARPIFTSTTCTPTPSRPRPRFFGAGRFTGCGDCLPALLRSKITVRWHPRPLAGPTFASAEFADIDADGAPDLVLGGNGFYRVDNDGIVSSDNQLLLNDGTEHFRISPAALPPRPFGNTALSYDVRAADITNDGKLDLLFANTKTEPFAVGRWIQILVNNGDGTFRDETASRLRQTDSNTSTFIKYLRLADLNGDGAVDLIGQLVEGGKDPPPVYLNNGHGMFTALRAGYGGTVDNVLTEVDLRRTGRRDFFTTGTYTYPFARSQIVPQMSPVLRPGTPAAPSIARAVRGGDRLFAVRFGGREL